MPGTGFTAVIELVTTALLVLAMAVFVAGMFDVVRRSQLSPRMEQIEERAPQ